MKQTMNMKGGGGTCIFITFTPNRPKMVWLRMDLALKLGPFRGDQVTFSITYFHGDETLDFYFILFYFAIHVSYVSIL